MSSSLAGFWVTLYGRIGVTPEDANIQNTMLYSRGIHSSRDQMGKALADWK